MRRLCASLAALAVAMGAAEASAQPARGAADAPQHVIVPPKLAKFVEAEFPASEAKAGHGATVVLQIAISATGAVAEVNVLESAGPAFDVPAVAAAKQFVFEPAIVDGKPIPVKITYRYVFKFEEKIVKKTTADFAGLVRDRRSKQPMASVRVALDTGQQALTDDEGRFSVPDVAPGEHTVTLSGEKLATVGTTETFEAAKRIDAVYEVDPKKEKAGGNADEEEELVVTAPRIKKQVVSTVVQAEQATRIPGTQGDVLKVVENLPGVARAAAGSGALVVWGSAPTDTRVYVEGVRVPRLYHDGGYRSIVSSDFVKSVELIPGGYGPTYGRGLGGLVTVALRPLDERGTHGSVAADTIDSSASVRAEVSDKVHVAIAARKSYLDTVLSAVTSENVGLYVPLPRYWDGQVRAVYAAGAHETLEVGGLISSDRTTRNNPNADPSLTTSSTSGTDFNRVYARYEKHLADGAVIVVTPSVGTDSTSLVDAYGATVTELTNDSWVYGLRAGWQGPVESFLRAAVGVDAEMQVSTLHRAGSIGAPPREGDIYVFGEPPPTQINDDDWKTVIGSIAPYAEGDFSLLEDTLHVVPGIRFEPYITSTNKLTPPPTGSPNIGYTHQEGVIEPRLSVRYAFTPRITGKAAVGIYHQSPQPEDLSSVFGTPTLALSTAQHYLAGGVFQLTGSLTVETTGFLAEQQNLATRSESESPLVGQALVQQGIGRSYGTQFLLRQQQVGHFFGWISYSILRSERRDAPNLGWRLFDYDQSHVFTAVGSYDLGQGFETGLRFRFATGYPRTPVIGAYYSSLTDTYEPIFGAHNSIRIPPFVSLDVRFAKRFKLGGKDELELYLDVQNVTDHSNPEEIVYNPTYTQRGYITGFPILPVAGARFSW
ncbi:MAG TPA: TonB family protein [Polyangiaceae bacterium]|jgi:TonB family protein